MTLGKRSYVGNNAELNAVVGHFISIGEDVYVHHGDNHAVAVNANLVSSYPFGDWCNAWPGTGHSKGEVIIDNDVWIGRGVKILTGVHIYSGAIVAAHAVVTKDVPPYAMVAGNPARIVKFRFSPPVIQKLLEIEWWGWEDDVLKERLPDMLDVKTFVEKYG